MAFEKVTLKKCIRFTACFRIQRNHQTCSKSKLFLFVFFLFPSAKKSFNNMAFEKVTLKKGIRFRAYFRIQRNHQTCSKRASYLGNTILSDSPNLANIHSISENRSKLVSQFHTFFVVYCNLQFLIESCSQRSLRISGNGRRTNLDNFSYYPFLNKVTVISPWRYKNHKRH